jgi:hypothetical protein
VTARSPLLLALSALVFAACSTPHTLRANEAQDHLSRFVLAPMNLAVRPPAELGDTDAVWNGLLSYFQRQDRQVALLSPASAERLWREANRNLDTSDRKAALRTASERFARGLAKHREYDALVVPSLVVRPARMHGRYAWWDGVRRLVPNGSRVINTGLREVSYPMNSNTVIGLSGKIAAASIHVSLYRPDGSLIGEAVGGLDIIQEARRDDTGKWVFELRSDPFANAEHLREGVEIAFERPRLALR